MTNSVYWVWFQLVFGVGTRRAHTLLEYFAHPRELYEGARSEGRIRAMLQEKELGALEPALERARILCERTAKKGCDIVTPDQKAYPEQLQNVFAKPAALTVKGDLRCLQGTLAMAMVGTRKYSSYGQRAAQHLARGLAECGAVVVSGLARGIDMCCHEAALAAGGESIGVLGCGIDVDYPKGSGPLKRALCEHGAVVTEYPLGTPPRPENFPMRNRIISGMAHGVVVVEADASSGSMITAAHALDQGRDVFAVPGDIFSDNEQGTHQLIRDGAKLVMSAADIVEDFAALKLPRLSIPEREQPQPVKAAASEPEPPPTQRERGAPPDGCSEAALLVYERIGPEPVTVDAVAEGVDLPVAQIQTALTELEIYGLIRGYPGRQFSL